MGYVTLKNNANKLKRPHHCLLIFFAAEMVDNLSFSSQSLGGQAAAGETLGEVLDTILAPGCNNRGDADEQGSHPLRKTPGRSYPS